MKVKIHTQRGNEGTKRERKKEVRRKGYRNLHCELQTTINLLVVIMCFFAALP